MVSVFVSRSMTIIVFFLMFFASVMVVEILKETLVDGDSGSNGTRALDTLRLLIVVSSHGNSGAAADYPGDPYPLTNPTFWPFGSLQLSPGGRVKMHSLGTKIRSLYQGFLSQTYRPEDMTAASTAVDRVVISGQAFLSGLYPPPHHRRKHKEVAWQPAPLYTDSPDHSTMLLDGGCAALDLAMAAAQAEFAATYAANLTAVIDYVNSATGANMTDASAVRDLYDKLLSETIEGYTEIPSWAEEIYPQVLQPLVGAENAIMFTNSPETVGLLIGELLADSLDVMKAMINGSSTQRLHFYSGHASSLLGLQTALGLPRSSLVSDVMPGSALLFELHQLTNSSQFIFQVLYIDGTSSDLEPVLVDLPECGNPCVFYTLANITRNFTSGVNFHEECSVSSTTLSPIEKQHSRYLSNERT